MDRHARLVVFIGLAEPRDGVVNRAEAGGDFVQALRFGRSGVIVAKRDFRLDRGAAPPQNGQ